MYYRRLTGVFIILLTLGLASIGLLGETYNPTTVAQLKSAISDANTNGEDDIIDLGGQTFTLIAVDNGVNGLPIILSDNSHTLLLRNGIIEKDGGPNFRFFELNTGADFSLENVIIRYADGAGDGGAILVNGGATISSIKLSTFLDNDANGGDGGAIALLPGATIGMICDTTFDKNTASGNGGAISMVDANIAIITSSAFIYNGGNNGGTISIIALASDSNIGTISNSTFSNNHASINGGAFYLDGTDDDEDLIASIDILANSTIVINDAPNGSGGGIYFANDFTSIGNLFSTIVALNSAVAGPDIFDSIASSISLESFNLVGQNTDNQLVAGDPNGNNSKIGTSVSPIDPLLDPLADNGGPTQTHAEQEGSPAIDMGSNSLLDLQYDQRGPLFLRTRGAGTDIGAYEVQNCDKNLGDVDEDGICGDVDRCPTDPENLCDPGDVDGDGIQNHLDNCIAIANTDQRDTDGDGIGDKCDVCQAGNNLEDSDNDGVCDSNDRCPGGDDADDADHDGVPDFCDNCVHVKNFDQTDCDQDGIGDACDDDECCYEPIVNHKDPIIPPPIPIIPPPPPPVPYPWISPPGAAVIPAPVPPPVATPLGPILEAPGADADEAQVEAIAEEDPIGMLPEYFDAESASVLPEEPIENATTSAGCSQTGATGQGANNMWLFMLLFIGITKRLLKTKKPQSLV